MNKRARDSKVEAVSVVSREDNERKEFSLLAETTTKTRQSGRPPLSAAERERLGAALHDGLGQLLTSISFLATSLRLKLAAKEMPEAAEADEIALLTGRAICETQALVRGDSPPGPGE